jgi:hypothetical protein
VRSRTRVRAHLRGKALGNSRGEISSYFVARAPCHVCSVHARCITLVTISRLRFRCNYFNISPVRRVILLGQSALKQQISSSSFCPQLVGRSKCVIRRFCRFSFFFLNKNTLELLFSRRELYCAVALVTMKNLWKHVTMYHVSWIPLLCLLFLASFGNGDAQEER